MRCQNSFSNTRNVQKPNMYNARFIVSLCIGDTFADCYLMLLLLLHVTVFLNPELQFV